MYSSTILIKDIDTAREFVDKMTAFMDTTITLNSGNYSVDGHSIICMLSLDITKPIEIVVSDDAPQALVDIIEQYAI